MDPNLDPGDRSRPAPSASGPSRPALWLATVGGLGYAPVAPGTVGSAAGVAIFVLLSLPRPTGLAVTGVIAASLLLFAAGVRAAQVAEAHFGREDDGRIVIDEVVGQLLTLLPLLLTPGAAGFAWLVTGFVLFRVFDVWKPGPVRWAERHFEGGLGVMMDDVVAGILGAVILGGLRLAAAGAA